MSKKNRYCKECGQNEVAARGYVCGHCRMIGQTIRQQAVRGPSQAIAENRRLAAKAISGDRQARRDLEKHLGSKERADKVIKSVMDSAASTGGRETLFQRLARGRR